MQTRGLLYQEPTSQGGFLTHCAQLLTWGSRVRSGLESARIPFVLASTVRNFLTRSRASRFYGVGAPASCPRSTEPHREGRADRGADRSAGVGGPTNRCTRRPHRRTGRPHRGAGGAARRTHPPAEDPRQLIEAALPRTE